LQEEGHVLRDVVFGKLFPIEIGEGHRCALVGASGFDGQFIKPDTALAELKTERIFTCGHFDLLLQGIQTDVRNAQGIFPWFNVGNAVRTIGIGGVAALPFFDEYVRVEERFALPI